MLCCAARPPVCLQEEGLTPVYAPFFPKEKDEQWWVVLGGRAPGQREGPFSSLLAIKRVTINKPEMRVRLEFEVPAEAQTGPQELVVYLISDSYLGCDLENKLQVNVTAAEMEE